MITAIECGPPDDILQRELLQGSDPNKVLVRLPAISVVGRRDFDLHHLLRVAMLLGEAENFSRWSGFLLLGEQF